MSCSHTTGTFDKGDLVRCEGTFRNVSGGLVDPDTLLFQFKDPNGSVTEYVYGVNAQIVRASIGVYYVDLNANQAGTWSYRFYSTGIAQAADETSFVVAASRFS